MKTRIHVNQHAIRSNLKNGADLPPISVRTHLGTTPCYEVEFKSGKVVYSPDKPLSCGARVWIETDEEVVITR